MRYLFIFLLVFLCSILNSQIVLEHTYSGNFNRTKLKFYGEKYYDFDPAKNLLNFYNADHSFWKSIAIPADTINSYQIVYVDDKRLNKDPFIELTFNCYSDSGKSSIVIFNELGKLLLKAPGNIFPEPLEPSNLSTKLMVSIDNTATAVYSVPQLTLEHQFMGRTKRIQVDNKGEMYFEVKADSILQIYRADFTLYKSVPIPSVIVGNYLDVVHASEKIIVADTLIEIGLKKLQQNAAIMNEQGSLIFYNGNAYNFQISQIPGFADKLCVDGAVYSLPGIVKEKAYSGFHPFRRLFASGPMYIMGWGDTIRFYNANHSFRAKIKASAPSGQTTAGWYFYSDYQISSDSKIEIGYLTKDFSLFMSGETRIANEDNTVLFTEALGNNLVVSEIGGGTQNKLLSYVSDSTGTWTKVYSLPTYDLTDLKEFSKSISDLIIFPNPATNYFELKINNFEVKRINIYDSAGKKVFEAISDDKDRIAIEQLEQGIYLIVIENRTGNRITKKLIKQ